MPLRVKKQHYVTRAYLEGFLDTGRDLLFCYGRHRPEGFQSRPSELAHERSYYSFREPDGTWNDSLEHEIERRVEGPGLDVIRKLTSGNTRLDWPERDALAMLMAVQRLRVPHLRQMLDTVHAEMIQNLLLEHDNMQREQGPGRFWVRSISPVARPRDLDRSRAYVTREELQQIQSELQEDTGQFSRETLFSFAVSFAKVIRRMKWTIFSASADDSFVTSDCPVLLRHDRTDIKHAGIVRPDTHIEFPLSRTSLLLMDHDLALINRVKHLGQTREARRVLARIPEIKLAKATEKQVHQFNVNQAEYCSRSLFCGRQCDWAIEDLRKHSKNVRHQFVRDGRFFRVDTLAGQR
jgi:hypothetical protein